MDDDELARLRRDMQVLLDRQAILDCIMRQARGHDRHDSDLMTAVLHHDGVDEHGSVVSIGAEYAEFANRAHAVAFVDHLHNITTHTCEIDGDTAHAESYVIGTMRMRDDKTVCLLGGRYLDRLERRDGEWRIALRRCTLEWVMNADTSFINSGGFKGFIKGRWDDTDASYARPLLAETDVDRW